MSVIRVFFAFLVAWAVCVATVSVIHTQFVIARMIGLGVDISLAERLSWTITDLKGLNDFSAPSEVLPVIMVIALFVGFLVAALLTRLFGGLRGPVFVVAGACAVVALLFTLKAVLGVMPIAGARGEVPMLVHGLAGVLAGGIFTLLTPAPRPKRA